MSMNLTKGQIVRINCPKPAKYPKFTLAFHGKLAKVDEVAPYIEVKLLGNDGKPTGPSIHVARSWLISARCPSLRALKREARAAATARGHLMTRFITPRDSYSSARRYDSVCLRCGQSVTVRLHPAPNEIDIGGGAIALTCRKEQS